MEKALVNDGISTLASDKLITSRRSIWKDKRIILVMINKVFIRVFFTVSYSIIPVRVSKNTYINNENCMKHYVN
jgi:hypothetical protein